MRSTGNGGSSPRPITLGRLVSQHTLAMIGLARHQIEP